jgi:hypothetical protein
MGKSLSWTPIRRGHIYCASACGGNCTKAAFDKATNESKLLALALGKRWTTRVHENLGWHYNVQSPCGRIRVHADDYMGRITGYTAFLGAKNDAGGRWVAHGRTPKTAVRNVLKTAKRYLDEIKEMIENCDVE